VNFFGHATVALWSSDEPLFVLGSMLPDLVGMAGLRLPRGPFPPALARGIELHHRTDEAFHADPLFLALTQRTLDELTAQGVPRGPARAVAHVGIELLLDGELLGVPGVAVAYESALASLDALAGAFDAENARWQALSQALRARGVPYDYRNTDAVVNILVRILARRPRLAVAPGSERIVRGAMPDLQRDVVAQTPAILAGLAAILKRTEADRRTTLF
jgi:acyl carrier protein phosphodiesterase